MVSNINVSVSYFTTLEKQDVCNMLINALTLLFSTWPLTWTPIHKSIICYDFICPNSDKHTSGHSTDIKQKDNMTSAKEGNHGCHFYVVLWLGGGPNLLFPIQSQHFTTWIIQTVTHYKYPIILTQSLIFITYSWRNFSEGRHLYASHPITLAKEDLTSLTSVKPVLLIMFYYCSKI